MSENKPESSWRLICPVLAGVALIFLAIFIARTTSKRADPTQTSQYGGPGSSATTRASQAAQSKWSAARERVAGHLTAGRLTAQTILKYGRKEGEVGMVNAKEQPPVGPESFAVGKDGSILVADVVNRRVQVYASNGTYLRAIALPGIALGDVTTDAQGRVYVYDQVRHSLHLYDAQGTQQSELGLSPADIDTRGYFHVAGNSIYFADAAERDVLVATLQDGVLTPADTSSERMTDGVHGDSGRIYTMSLAKRQALRLEVRDPATQSATRSLEVPLPGIVSARYAGEDQAQQFYIQTERLDGTSTVLEVLVFSPTGEHLATTRMPENDYAVWTAKLVDIGADGTIVQFLPQQGQAKLNLFTN